MSLIERKIDVTFELATDQFNATGNTVKLTGLRCTATVDNINGVSLGSLQLRIYGMLKSDMQKLSNLGKLYLMARKNLVTVEAGDDDSGMSQVFKGTIFQGAIDYTQPDVAFNVAASSAYFESLQKPAPVSIEGTGDVATMIQSIATSIGFTFKNNGVTAQLANPYLDGSPIQQIRNCAQYANIACDISAQSVTIWPNGGTRDSETLQISPSNGLVGYPTYSQYGIDVTTIFNPNLLNGRKVHVESDAIGAQGDWYCQISRHELSSQIADGPWFTLAQLTGEGFYVAH